ACEGSGVAAVVAEHSTELLLVVVVEQEMSQVFWSLAYVAGAIY
uniref:Uncharacterized protein n=1 Tax=Aegilops tauschii subsp. strangulata TaxID=200361 RepID=A0A453MY85_AEGTS